MPAAHLERALFVVAPQDSGKSTTLRSLFLDRRLGEGGKPPPSSRKKLPDDYYLSNERRLYLRLTSPHEYGETIEEFIQKCQSKMSDGRWCFAGAFQPDAANQMPDITDTVKRFSSVFDPERMRVAFLSPNRHGTRIEASLPNKNLEAVVDSLFKLPKVEVLCVDGRHRGKNGLLLADFFDFT